MANRTLTACYIGDGYLYGASSNPFAALPAYWPSVRHEDGFTLRTLANVPADIAARLEDHGTSSQYYADGYEAARAAAPFLV